MGIASRDCAPQSGQVIVADVTNSCMIAPYIATEVDSVREPDYRGKMAMPVWVVGPAWVNEPPR